MAERWRRYVLDMLDTPPMNELLRRNLIPLIVATALFMENLDATVLATSLPAIAKDLGANPINLKLALTTYLLALAVFIPASGWMADRFGAKNIFRAAMVVFAAGSIACALSTGLGSLVAARVLQGMGGAMMTPVGRLIVLRTVPRAEMIGAIAWLIDTGARRPSARTTARRLHHDVLRLALDLLDQHSGGARSASC